MLVEIRAYRDDDFPALRDLHQAIATAAGSDRLVTAADLEEQLLAPGYDRHGQLFVAEADGRLVAQRDFRIVWTKNEPYPQLETFGAIHPTARGSDLGERMIRHAWRQGAPFVRSRGADRVILQGRCTEDDADLQQVYRNVGLMHVRDNYTMVHDDLPSVEPSPLPDGVELRAYRPGEDDERWWQAWTEAFATHWGQIFITRDYWTWFVRLPSFFPELSLVAATGESRAEIAGFCHARIEGRPGAPIGRKNGTLRWVGVRPAWRRQGLGDALTRAGLIALREAGAARVSLGVDADSWTGADRLYQHVGFRIHQRNLFFRRELSLAELARAGEPADHVSEPLTR